MESRLVVKNWPGSNRTFGDFHTLNVKERINTLQEELLWHDQPLSDLWSARLGHLTFNFKIFFVFFNFRNFIFAKLNLFYYFATCEGGAPPIEHSFVWSQPNSLWRHQRQIWRWYKRLGVMQRNVALFRLRQFTTFVDFIQCEGVASPIEHFFVSS